MFQSFLHCKQNKKVLLNHINRIYKNYKYICLVVIIKVLLKHIDRVYINYKYICLVVIIKVLLNHTRTVWLYVQYTMNSRGVCTPGSLFAV